MPSIKPRFSDVLRELPEVTEREEDEFHEIPGWDGTVEAVSDKAIMIRVIGSDDDVWLPKSQLRAVSRDNVIVASLWILEQKGLV